MQHCDDNALTLLVAEDDPDHQILISEAMAAARLANKIQFVANGQDALDCLRGQGQFANDAPIDAGLVMLDLNMPIMDGRETVSAMRQDPNLKHIPIVILTTSESTEDIANLYDLGANSFVTKPVTFDGLVDVMRSIGDYWFQIVKLPGGPAAA